jgi:hypothetical protein
VALVQLPAVKRVAGMRHLRVEDQARHLAVAAQLEFERKK